MTRKKPTPPVALVRHPWADFEDEFHRLLGRLVHTTARLDFTVGLQLNSLGPFYGFEVANHLDPVREHLSGRLKVLKKILQHSLAQAPVAVREDFDGWFERVDRARAMRNDYVHGRWAAPGAWHEAPSGHRIDAKPLLVFVPLNWDMRADRPDTSIKMTLEDLAAQVTESEFLVNDYMQLVDRHVAYMAPGWQT